MKKGWQLVYSTGQTHLAEIMKSVLHDQGIETFVVDKRDSSYVALGEIEFYVSSGHLRDSLQRVDGTVGIGFHRHHVATGVLQAE